MSKGKFLNLFSIDESRVSVIIASYIVFTIVAIYQIITTKDISDNLLNLISYQLVAVAGVNVADKFNKGTREDDGNG